jgi:hypothetical protein
MTMKWIACLVAVVIACGVKPRAHPSSNATTFEPKTATDRILTLLPDGAQLVIEVDLARLRANPVVGPLVVKALGPSGIERFAGFADADTVVLASYGLGTSDAATITLMSARADIKGTTKVADGIYAHGPGEWISQVKARAAIARTSTLTPPKDLLELRGRAMPEGAPGASLRISARLGFDARIALARITGVESAPAQLSVWADVADDFAIVVDADATDPGEKKPKQSLKRMTAVLQAALHTLASDPTMRLLGLPSSLSDAKVVQRGMWVRAILAIGPRHLQRVVERATGMFEPPSS